MEHKYSTPVPPVIKTKILKMYYVNLPVVDLTHRFMYRFEEPVATVWRKGVLSWTLQDSKKSAAEYIDDQLKQYGLTQWFKMATSGMNSPMPQDARWLLEVDSCELVECEIVPKASKCP